MCTANKKQKKRNEGTGNTLFCPITQRQQSRDIESERFAKCEDLPYAVPLEVVHP